MSPQIDLDDKVGEIDDAVISLLDDGERGVCLPGSSPSAAACMQAFSLELY